MPDMLPTLSPTGISLRSVQDTDLPTFFDQQLDPETTAMAGVPPRDLPSFLAHWEKIRNNRQTFLKTILWDGQLAGYVLSFPRDGKREVGYWLGRDYWGQGVATQALMLFLEDFEERPLYGVVAKPNIASRRVLEKCGFLPLEEHTEKILLILQ